MRQQTIGRGSWVWAIHFGMTPAEGGLAAAAALRVLSRSRACHGEGRRVKARWRLGTRAGCRDVTYPRRHPLDEGFQGICPFHGDCLEGLASGPAILARTGSSLQELNPAHAHWGIEADYLGQLCAQLVLTVAPERIIIGGGVMSQQRLSPSIRQRLRHWLGGYIDRPEILTDTDRYIVPPSLGT
jgi:hypothetical protein